MLAALMLLAIAPLATFAASDPVELYLGFGTWNGTQFSDGMLIRPGIWQTISDVSGLKAAVVKPGAVETAEEQTSPYTITNPEWTVGVVEDDYHTMRFDWTEKTTIEFDLYSEGILPTNYVNGSYELDVSKITLKVAGTSGAELKAATGRISGSGVRYHVAIEWTKRTCIFGLDMAQLTAFGLPLENYKVSDAFPTYTVTGERAKYYTVETNWYYAEGTPGHYSRGAKVTESTIQADVAYDCELTFKLKSDAPVPSTGTPLYIANDGTVEAVLFNTATSKNSPGYFRYGEFTGVHDNPDNQTLTARRVVTYEKIVKDVEVIGVSIPVVGATPQDYGIGFAAPFDDWTVMGASWSGDFAADGTFKAGEKYTLTLGLSGVSGDLTELNELNARSPREGYKLVSAEGGTVVEFIKLETSFRMKIEYIAEPEDLGTFYIHLNNGKVTVNPEDPTAFNASINAMSDAIDFDRNSISPSEDYLDLNKDGKWDVVVQNGNQYQAHSDASVSGTYAVEMSDLAYSKIKSSGVIAYYSKIAFIFSGSSRPGDADGDGNINARDVILAMKASLPGFIAPADYNKLNADVEADGLINARDVIAIMKLALLEATAKG